MLNDITDSQQPYDEGVFKVSSDKEDAWRVDPIKAFYERERMERSGTTTRRLVPKTYGSGRELLEVDDVKPWRLAVPIPPARYCACDVYSFRVISFLLTMLAPFVAAVVAVICSCVQWQA